MSRRSVKFREAVRQNGGVYGNLIPQHTTVPEYYNGPDGSTYRRNKTITHNLTERKRALWDRWSKPKS